MCVSCYLNEAVINMKNNFFKFFAVFPDELSYFGSDIPPRKRGGQVTAKGDNG
jgi:hypothetical protein